ncbi:cytochrome P450 [Epithele typhae]|uniref:cytochrome P450 n=1 Tax=Epithele typhae TaxID=378194 RepID=UPI002007DEBE|nr:cytochrome P450 [Epithele typhae]KAH9910899.1 cytochrome P450 [Epithele typhae]
MVELELNWSTAVIGFAAVFAASRIINYLDCDKRTGHLPGLRSFATPISLFGTILPSGRWNPGRNWQWETRKEVYARHGTETISALPYCFGAPIIYTSSPEVSRQLMSVKEFFKHPEITILATMWGPNLFSTDGEQWRRMRRIMTPAFNHSTYVTVWENTSRTYREMTSNEGWDAQKTIEVPNITRLTAKFTLILISCAGFGFPLSWDFSQAEGTDKMSFGEALHIISENLILRLVLPNWSRHLPVQSFKDLHEAYEIAGKFLHTLIDDKRREFASGATPGNDVLSLMIQSAESEGKSSMTDEELTGNLSILLLAGQETLAFTLNATLGYMALYPEFQEEMYQEVMSAMPTADDVTLANSHKLRKVQACMLEAARLFPAVSMMIRDSCEDIVLEHVGPNRDERIAVPAGTRFVVDMIGLHHNPRTFPDPEAFKPERWYDAPENALTQFSFGPRVCLCFLAHLVRDFRVERLAAPGESRERWEARYMQGAMPLRLVRRG